MSLFKHTVIASHMTIQERRKLLDSSAGRIFAVQFVKKDGTVRDMTCKKFVERHLTYGIDNVQHNPVAHKPELYTVSDIGAADAFRNISLDKLKKVSINGVDYVF